MFFNTWTLILTTLVLGLASYLFHSFKKLSYFKDHGIPHITPLPILGNFAPIVFRKLYIGELIQKLYKMFPNAKYFGFYDFMNPVIVLRDLELIKSVAVKNFDSFPDHKTFFGEWQEPLLNNNLFSLKGDKWHSVRALLSPAFTSSKMKIMYQLISQCAVDFTEFLSNDTQANQERDMKDVLSKYTNDVIATCAFGISVNTMKDPENEFYTLGKDMTNPVKMALKFFILRTFPKIMRIFDIRLVSSRIDRFFTDIIRSTIDMRDSKGITRPDMLQLMMDSRKENNKIKLTPEEVTAQAFIFFFGGFDSISTYISLVTYELALNPEIQTKLQEEIDSVLRASNGNPSYEAIHGMEYFEAILNETLRRHSIAPSLDRVCTKRFDLPPAVPGAKPFTVEPGTTVWIPVCAIQSDPAYYEEPEKFDPDRFLSNGTASNKSTTFLAFGLGPRQCIGNRFAMLESKVVLFHLLARCDLRVCAKTTVPFKVSKKTVSLTPEGGYWLKIEKRNTNFVTNRL